MTLWETLASMKKVPLGHHLKKGALGGAGLGIRRGLPRKVGFPGIADRLSLS